MNTTNAITVAPFAVAVDQREKAPYAFAGMSSVLVDCRGYGRLVVKVERQFLNTGDYSIVGCEDLVAVERKSLEDLYSTLGQHRDRFEAEFERLNAMDVAAVMIEATWGDVRAPEQSRGMAWRSRLSPKSVMGTIQQWTIRFPKVHWYAPGSRRAAEQGTFLFLERFWRETHK